MKVIYIFRSGNSLSGVHRKVNSQMQLLRANGVDCITHNICSGCPHINNEYARTFAIPDFNSRIKILSTLQRELFVVTHLEDQIRKLDEQDIIYMRIPYPSIFLSRLLSRERACKIIIEHQSIEPLEYRSIGKYWYLCIDYLFGDAIRENSDGIVGVTDEITRYELTRAGDSRKPSITIGNGYDVESVTLRSPPILSDESLDLLCVSNVRPWHGVDRLIRGLAVYRGPTRVTLHITGEGSELPRIKKIAADLNVSDRVIYHGFQTGESLERLYNACHLAVGSLGLHRIGLTQGSILKSREYCARGIPYIIACADPDIPDDFPYVRRVPSDDSPINIESVIEFARDIYSDQEHPKHMRTYAKEHLDWSIKMDKLKDFFFQVVNSNTSIR